MRGLDHGKVLQYVKHHPVLKHLFNPELADKVVTDERIRAIAVSFQPISADRLKGIGGLRSHGRGIGYQAKQRCHARQHSINNRNMRRWQRGKIMKGIKLFDPFRRELFYPICPRCGHEHIHSASWGGKPADSCMECGHTWLLSAA